MGTPCIRYRLGKGVPRDLKKSVALAKKAAQMVHTSPCLYSAGGWAHPGLSDALPIRDRAI